MVLASASPRRKSILLSSGYEFEVITEEIDEGEYMNEADTAKDTVTTLARLKGEAVLHKISGDVTVISADTVVVLNNKIIGKPKDEKDAFEILSRLSGNPHFVYTCAYIFRRKEGAVSAFPIVDSAKVYMGAMSHEEITGYINTKEPMDKAGAYGIQGLGALFVDRIEGDFYNIYGLPLRKVYLKLKEMGIYPDKFKGPDASVRE